MQEVLDHRVQWNASFTFPCKMMANASTGVMERCLLRVSVRKESKGGRSFTKLGFVDLNLAEYAGAGVVRKKALLEGYDARRRQDNSMLKFRIELSMVSGDILFKAPSPSLKHKQINVDEGGNEQRSDEFSSGSLAGSIASGSSGFGSLPKKRPALLSSDLVIGQTLQETNAATPPIVGDYASDLPTQPDPQEPPIVPTSTTCSSEPGHSRNSSNTSQLSKASGYSSGAHSHSRQSSSGDSGHVRGLPHHRKLLEGASTGKLAPLAISPDDESPAVVAVTPPATNDTAVGMATGGGQLQQCQVGALQNGDQRRCSITTNPSAGSLVISETGSLDRAKAAYERRKKNKEDSELGSSSTAPGRVEITRVNPDDLIEELLKNTNLETADDSAETSGLQLFIAKDGTAAVGNHEVKSQMQTGGVQIFKQVVMDDR
ncbi:unnamed protein product [Acanthoscelides obtectus]|uniref:C2 NT-type domain-containing protein n=1 Tax=Acanthoscelides obtectus TaxID=200917 RepID=A0A9P0Q0L4_ACAOB|nr:unnamed protein product [Acanthoscelides obtectus]CAK1665604.1 Protein FAM102B [Acanthoscelides obtectus]